jgi:hypothetical protein
MQHKLLFSVNNGLKVLEMYAWLLDSYVLVSLVRHCELELVLKSTGVCSDQQTQILVPRNVTLRRFNIFLLTQTLTFFKS